MNKSHIVTQIHIRPTHPLFPACVDLTYKAKVLYNTANYLIRQTFFAVRDWRETQDLETHAPHWETLKPWNLTPENTPVYLNYYTLARYLKSEEAYRALPAQTAQAILKESVDHDWQAFFRSIKEYAKHPETFLGKPGLPHYKDRASVVFFTNQQCRVKNGMLHFPKTLNLPSVKLPDTIPGKLMQVRIIPQHVTYTLEIVWQVPSLPLSHTVSQRIAGIDLGIENLITCTTTMDAQPFVVNGRGIKAYNQGYHRTKEHLQKQLIAGQYWSRRLALLEDKRQRKFHEWFHQISRFIVNWCVQHTIDTLVIGHNAGWKQKNRLRKSTKQHFASIPFNRLIAKIQYKAEQVGIRVMLTEESYTSKASFLDQDALPVWGQTTETPTFSGKRIHRGLYRSGNGTLINADVNGAYNIIRKVFPNAFANGIAGVALHPVRISPHKGKSSQMRALLAK